jgi:hypothetical protein
MRACGVELALLAEVDHRLSQPFGIAGLPIGAGIIVGEVDQHERGVAYLRKEDVVNDPCARDFAQIDQILDVWSR